MIRRDLFCNVRFEEILMPIVENDGDSCITKGRRLSVPRTLAASVRYAEEAPEAVATDTSSSAPANILAEDLPFPVAVLKSSAMGHNRRWMRTFVETHRVALAPHGKTTMSPQLFRRQMADGAWGMTAATVQQAAVMHACGIRRVLLANQLAGRAAMRWAVDIADGDRNFELISIVDSVALVKQLNETARAAGATRPLALLVELGVAGGRTGCRTLDDAMSVARAVAAAPELMLLGIEAYEGSVPGGDDAVVEEGVRQLVADIAQFAARCDEEALLGPGPVLLSAGGSAYFDLVTALPRHLGIRETTVVLRSGCYLTFDDGFYLAHWQRMMQRTPAVSALGEGLRPALEVWACVQSTPEPELAIVTMGKRDVSHDLHLPMPRWHVRRTDPQRTVAPAPESWRVAALNDQHGFLRVAADARPKVGDLVGFSVSHPCTTFDKWRAIPVVDDSYRVIEKITTCF
jgi:D-serine dehydratase